MAKELRIYRNVDSLFGRFLKNAVRSWEEPDYPKHYPEYGFTEDAMTKAVMEDGLVVEICDWHDGGIYVTDVSVSIEEFDRLQAGTFEEYARSKGIYTENISVGRADFYYSNQGRKNGCYRIQYYLDLDD